MRSQLNWRQPRRAGTSLDIYYLLTAVANVLLAPKVLNERLVTLDCLSPQKGLRNNAWYFSSSDALGQKDCGLLPPFPSSGGEEQVVSVAVCVA